MKLSEVTVKNLADYLRLDYSTLGEEEITQLATFRGIAESFIESFTGLSIEEIDKYKELVIVLYSLVADMHDNRLYHVDKSNLNVVIERILYAHSKNLL